MSRLLGPKTALASSLLVLATASLSAHAAPPSPPPAPAPSRAPRAPVPLDGVAAVVDDVFIFRSEVAARAKHFLDKLTKDPVKRRAELAELDKQIVNRLIDELLIKKDADKLHLTATDAEVASGIDSVAQNNKMDRKALEAEVAKAGYTLVDYQEEIRRQVLDGKWVMLKSAGKIDRSKLGTDQAAFGAAMEKVHDLLVQELRHNAYIEIR